jgi:hypothetical protein
MLAPIILTDEQLEAWENQNLNVEEIPSKTYKIDFDTGNITAEFIDGESAVLQYCEKIIKTFRYKYLIYTDDIGSELNQILGKSYSEDYIKLEAKRLIKEALEIDDRILSMYDFEISLSGDVLYVSFSLETNVTDKILTVEVTI